MLYDTDRIRALVDVRQLARRYWGEPAFERPLYAMYHCFVHVDRRASLSVRQDGYRCFGCGATGDAIKLLMLLSYSAERPEVAFCKACAELSDKLVGLSELTVPPPLAAWSGPPGADFQVALQTLSELAQRALFARGGQQALHWLCVTRGLNESVVRQAGLGWIDRLASAQYWQRVLTELGLRLAVSEGILLPWHSAGQWWGIKVRRPQAAHSLRYTQVTATDERRSEAFRPRLQGALYGVDDWQGERPRLLVEGELNCLSVRQVAADWLDVASIGSASAQLSDSWATRLSGASFWFDADSAGQAAAVRLAGQFTVTRLIGSTADANERLLDGSLRSFLQDAL